MKCHFLVYLGSTKLLSSRTIQSPLAQISDGTCISMFHTTDSYLALSKSNLTQFSRNSINKTLTSKRWLNLHDKHRKIWVVTVLNGNSDCNRSPEYEGFFIFFDGGSSFSDISASLFLPSIVNDDRSNNFTDNRCTSKCLTNTERSRARAMQQLGTECNFRRSNGTITQIGAQRAKNQFVIDYLLID